jgi:threonine dehydrogenase-like Zn-dependent dehydrogenase
MKQLTCTAPGTIERLEVPEPVLVAPTDALVRPIAVARCELDPLLILLGPTGDEGFALGHEAVVEVVAVGGAVTDLAVGQLVLPSFQLSCGACPTCGRGHTANCDEYPVLSDYGMQPLSGVEYGGMLADLVRVPHADTMLTRLPDGLDPVSVASVPDNVADGYRSVAPHLGRRPGADVLVVSHGLPSISLYAAQSALALGAASVTVASDDDEVLGLADVIGATPLRTEFVERAGTWPIVVDAGTRVEVLRWAVRATEPEGTLHSVSYYGGQPTVAIPMGRLYTLGIQVHTGRAHSAALLPEVIALVAGGQLHPEVVTTRVADWEDAPAAYLEPAVKLVVTRPPTTSATASDPGARP